MQLFNFYFHSPQYCSTKALSGITTVSHIVLKLGRESGMKKRVKMKMFKGAQLLWKLIKNRQRNVRRGRKVPFGRNKWISAVILQTLLSAVFPWTHTFHIRVVVQASGPSFYQFLPHSLAAPLMVMLRCRLERYALRLWRSASLCQPHHIIFFFSIFCFVC